MQIDVIVAFMGMNVMDRIGWNANKVNTGMVINVWTVLKINMAGIIKILVNFSVMVVQEGICAMELKNGNVGKELKQ